MANRLVAAAMVLSAFSVAQAASSLQGELDEVLRRKADPVAGEQRYTAECSGCHGASGAGEPDGLAPRIAGQRYSVIAAELVSFRQGQRADDRMQGRASSHVLRGAQEIADVAAHAAQLRGGPVGRGSGNLSARGEQIFANRCGGCHGSRAEGRDSPAIPRLAGQHYRYLLRQLNALVDGRRPAAARDHLQPLNSLDPDQLSAVADHLSRLP